MRYRASSRLTRGGVDIELLSNREQFEELCKEFGREVTLWLKRIRKRIQGKLRYLLVFERHKSGLPHAHILVHDMDVNHPVRHADLASEWKLGFTKFKLCEALKTAWYVAKYLSKSVESRVRASLGYGKVQPSFDIGPQQTWPVQNPATPETQFHGGPSKSEEVNENENSSSITTGLLQEQTDIAGASYSSPPAVQAPPSSQREATSGSAPASGKARLRNSPEALDQHAWAFIAKFAALWPSAEVSASVRSGRSHSVRLVPVVSAGK